MYISLFKLEFWYKYYYKEILTLYQGYKINSFIEFYILQTIAKSKCEINNFT